MNSIKKEKQKNREYQELEQRYLMALHELDQIKSSKGWKIIQKIRGIGVLKNFWSIFKLIKEGGKHNFYRIKTKLLKILKPRFRRKINHNSKRIVLVDHSYHSKTLSVEITLVRYLREHFDVTLIYDESWKDEPFPDLSFVDDTYLGVLFFQNIPPIEELNKINNENIIFLPMYDSFGNLEYDFWEKYKDLKFINFSKTLHKKLKGWGLDSFYIQYFVETPEFTPGHKDEVFFWQRINTININTVDNILDDSRFNIHLHKAVDPGHKFVKPSKELIKKYSIKITDWFKERSDIFRIRNKKSIFIAPREYEGIGLLFLEEMALGKAVIAVDNPTMNEYIKHNKTGYLYNLDNPKKIDLSNIEQVQKNAYNYMRKGFKNLAKRRLEMLKFIKKS